MKLSPQQKRAKERRDAHNDAMRQLLPRQPTIEERKARAERVMAAHDAELERKLGLISATERSGVGGQGPCLGAPDPEVGPGTNDDRASK